MSENKTKNHIKMAQQRDALIETLQNSNNDSTTNTTSTKKYKKVSKNEIVRKVNKESIHMKDIITENKTRTALLNPHIVSIEKKNNNPQEIQRQYDRAKQIVSNAQNHTQYKKQKLNDNKTKVDKDTTINKNIKFLQNITVSHDTYNKYIGAVTVCSYYLHNYIFLCIYIYIY